MVLPLKGTLCADLLAATGMVGTNRAVAHIRLKTRTCSQQSRILRGRAYGYARHADTLVCWYVCTHIDSGHVGMFDQHALHRYALIDM